jgi:hypothetical protein
VQIINDRIEDLKKKLAEQESAIRANGNNSHTNRLVRDYRQTKELLELNLKIMGEISTKGDA